MRADAQHAHSGVTTGHQHVGVAVAHHVDHRLSFPKPTTWLQCVITQQLMIPAKKKKKKKRRNHDLSELGRDSKQSFASFFPSRM